MPLRLLAVLRQLSSDVFISGEEIARRIGCSRATVHNALQQAEQAGLRVQAVRGRGYRLADQATWLEAEKLHSALARRGMTLELVDILPSTNTHLMNMAQRNAPHRSVVIADWQTGGRGRLGRTWLAPPGTGIQFSLLWRFGRSVAELSGLSLAVGVILAQALRESGLASVQLKWPNDILLGGAKLAGVLIELTGDMQGPASAVIGVGLNVGHADGIALSLGHAVADLSSGPLRLPRTEVLLSLIGALDDGLKRFDTGGFRAFRDPWHALHAHQGLAVVIRDGSGGQTRGVALGVDEHGALKLRTQDGERRFHTGEVSLRTA